MHPVDLQPITAPEREAAERLREPLLHSLDPLARLPPSAGGGVGGGGTRRHTC
jgi:hypothetical protein